MEGGRRRWKLTALPPSSSTSPPPSIFFLPRLLPLSTVKEKSTLFKSLVAPRSSKLSVRPFLPLSLLPSHQLSLPSSNLSSSPPFLPSLPAVDPATRPSAFAQSLGGPAAAPGVEESDKYVINIKQIAKFVVGLGDKVAPTDVEEGMRVG